MGLEVEIDLTLQLDASSLRIGGQSEIILCASLFYFRIPRASWRERLEQVKAFGYNAIDVYFPWNYHERQEGSWDFGGERNVEAFLQQAAEAGLWVVARPGPYICSEWDGGSLPGHLIAKSGLVIRSSDPVYLQAVAGWYDRILPILKKYELGNKGTIICLQLENELDFYDCPDPHSYMAALRDMALDHGIKVPLIACAGQGGLYEASGFAENVIPTCNFYPNDTDPDFEAKVTVYKDRLAAINVPLMVTETNRSHFLLRRLLSCGAKLLGPYLQVSGTNFGFTNGTNNWGKPLSFLTSDYDFGGMISPEGHIRAQAYEGRLLRRVINTYGRSLAEAEPSAAQSTILSASGAAVPTSVLAAKQLNLTHGGHLLFIVGLGEQEEQISIELANQRFIPQVTKLTVAPEQCPILPVEVPLSTWGLEGTLLYSTAELIEVKHGSHKTIMVFHSEHEGEIALHLGAPAAVIDKEGMIVHDQEEAQSVLVSFTSGRSMTCLVELEGGHLLQLIGLTRTDALSLEEIDESGLIKIGQQIQYDVNPRHVDIAWSLQPIESHTPMASSGQLGLGQADYLENNGIYRGFAWYEAVSGITAEQSAAARGILIHQGSDVVSVYAGANYVGTAVPGGGTRFLRLPSAIFKDERLTARVEIWGHTNFDDARLPALKLNSLKGLTGLTTVTNVASISSNWSVYRAGSNVLQAEFIKPDHDDTQWPIVSFGNWLSPEHPAYEYYRLSFQAAETADSWTIGFPGIQALASVFVNGSHVGKVNPFDPYVDITAHVTAGEAVQITVFLERVLGLPACGVILYEGIAARDFQLSGCEEAELLKHAAQQEQAAEPVQLPVIMESGSLSWFYGKLRDSGNGNGWRVNVTGTNMKLTVFFGQQLVGRIWTEGGDSRPMLTGGSQDSFYLPGAWFQEGDNTLSILLEAVEAGSPSSLEALTFIPVSLQT